MENAGERPVHTRNVEYYAKEYLEQVKCCKDTDCTLKMMKQAFLALKGGDWEGYKGIFRVRAKASEWAFDRGKEAFEQVAQDEAEKVSIVQKERAWKYRLASWRTRRRHDVILVPALQQFSSRRLCLVGLSGEKSTPVGGVQFLERSTTGGNRTGFWSCKQAKVTTRLKSSERTRYHKVCVKT